MTPLNNQRVRPPALRPGDGVGIIAPASNLNADDFRAGFESLRQAGYHPVYFDSIFEQDLYFAGPVDRRVRELNDMLARADVRAIICARGGYGANYLLPYLDIEKIKAHPKIFVGYSDITCLLTRILDAAGLITFHGPMAAKDWAHADGVDWISWQAALSGAAEWDVPLADDVRGIVDGESEGKLYGGCLSILVASLGTPYEIQTEETILFLEDVATKPYQVDRMLMQLKLAGKLSGLRGMVFGQMLDCVQTANQGYTLEEVIMRIVEDLRIPVAFGVRSGHVTGGNITLPLGVKARLAVNSGKAQMRILEPAVAE